MKSKFGVASILTAVVAIFAIVATILYNNVMYQFGPVKSMLYAAIAVAVIGIALAPKFPRISNYFPIALAALTASVAVWGTQLMVNQIGYVIAGLDEMGTIISYVWFVGCAVGGLMVSIIASFLQMGKANQ